MAKKGSLEWHIMWAIAWILYVIRKILFGAVKMSRSPKVTMDKKTIAKQLEQYAEQRAKRERDARLETLQEAGSIEFALPKGWFNLVLETTGVSPSGHIVWYYPATGCSGGRPEAVTGSGEDLLRLMRELENCNFL